MSEDASLAVVLAAPETSGDARDAVAALARCCEISAVELAAPAAVELPTLPPTWRLRRLETPVSALVPEQWGAGVLATSASRVALLSTEIRVRPEWRARIDLELGAGAFAAAGGIALAAAVGPATAATYVARFHAFLPRRPGPATDVSDLPGEGAVYRRQPLLELTYPLATGFWEVEIHRAAHARGGALRRIPEALIDFAGPSQPRAVARARWNHAARFGADRVRSNRSQRLVMLAKAPLVPVVLLARMARRALASREGRRALRLGWPYLALYAAAWSFGEARGACGAHRKSIDP